MKAFSQVNIDDLNQMFGITNVPNNFLPKTEPILPPEWLSHFIEMRRQKLATIRSEKATSESLISPILVAVEEIEKNKITLFSGEPLSTPELSGVCDFIITKGLTIEPKNGYLILVEAKKQDLLSGIPQCIAEMYAAQQLNGNNDTVYGCVSTGLEWIFLKLEYRTATTDPTIFSISEVPKILGVFGWIINQ